MSDHISMTIAQFQKKLAEQEAQVLKTKRAINMLCEEDNRPPIYADTEATTSSISSIRRDQFYGRALATVIREYLAMRRAANLGAATVNEIYDALLGGGYKFGAKNDENAKRGLQISLSKNQAFHRVAGAGAGAWGLTEWYPNAKSDKGPSSDADNDSDDTDDAGDEPEASADSAKTK